ncbi:exonuclease RecJ [Bacillus oleivorans]|uniref:Single-stranded-DNA-specific exonuclease RecJ n=1 Tax=Bacillus oleivorans TaxID=1448271 RepID=A0A285CX60_9BACI|nr:single-stranded-DNA-specific exonuclease RecJ [Bacillus oleivorans]SNX71658.1 exonuclease RecJ [Bacillus oleivorans]
MLNSKNRWLVSEADSENIQQLSIELEVSPLLAKLLASRGLDKIEKAKQFIHTDFLQFHDPFLIRDMNKAVTRIKKAIEKQEPILVFGDYDADGVTSTTVMMTVLQDLGANVQFYIPDRFTEGYGPNKEAFYQAKEEGIQLIITVDTGISAIEEIEFANELEMDVIITDHHEPGETLPDAYAIIHPKVGEDYPFPFLAGVGVAWKVAHALYGTLPEHLIELACIGTVADLVPLQDENRLIVIEGLKKLRQTTLHGLLALLSCAKVDISTIDEETIGFTLGPRLNAPGRLTHAATAVLLLLTKDKSEAFEYAQEIEALNKERQKIVQDTVKEAIKQVEQTHDLDKDRVIVVGSKSWNSGVIGIVASKLVQEYYRPTFVFSIDEFEGTAKGSARSIHGFDLYENLTEVKDVLQHYGGHPMAAGMSLLEDDLKLFKERMNKLAIAKLNNEDLIPVIKVDARLTIDDIDIEAVEELKMLSPFGVQNPKPRVLIENATALDIRKIGADKTHLKMTIRDQSSVDVIGFGFGGVADEIAPLSSIEIVGELSINEWNNRKKPQLMMQDVCVKEWQLFDWRGIQGIHEKIDTVPSEKRKIIFFNHTSLRLLNNRFKENIVQFQNTSIASDDYIILWDLPTSMDQLTQLFHEGMPARIYAYFASSREDYFQTVPTREHFKWFYSYLLKYKSFNLKKHSIALAKRKGWTNDTIEFISKVFFELEFVTIDNGVVSINPTKQKRDLADSPTYKMKVERVELEKELLYSSYSQLKAIFEKSMNRHEKAREEIK